MAKRSKNAPEHRVVYWDACIWIAWLQSESRKPGEMEGVITSVEHVSAGRSDLVVSNLILRLEVPQEKMTREGQELFNRTLKRPNVVVVDFEEPILRLHKEITRFYQKEKKAGRVKAELDWYDALHLATAINRRVDAFYTFDAGKKGGLSLLGLDGDVAGYELEICVPPYSQAPLLF